MEVKTQAKLKFNGVNFVDIKFNSSRFYTGDSRIDVNIIPRVFYPDNNKKVFNILMEVNLICEDIFTLNLIGIGEFELDKEIIDDKLKKTFINTNAPAIMFPYVRSFITTLTANIGNVTGPLVIPTQFFKGELEEIENSDE